MTMQIPDGWTVSATGLYVNHDHSCQVSSMGAVSISSNATPAQFLEAVAIAKQVRGIADEPANKARKIVAISEDASGRSVAFDDGTMWCQAVLGPEWHQVILPPTKEAT